MTRLVSIFSLVLLVSAAPAIAADGDLERLMGALAQRRQGHVTFTERKYIALLDRPVESSGELIYQAPDHLEKRTLKPKPENLVLEGGVVTAQRGRRRYVLELQRYPQVVPFIESIRATLAGDTQALERVYQVRFEGSFDRWSLGLTPRDSKLTASVKDIRITGERDSVHSVEIQEADGDHSVLSIGTEVQQ